MNIKLLIFTVLIVFMNTSMASSSCTEETLLTTLIRVQREATQLDPCHASLITDQTQALTLQKHLIENYIGLDQVSGYKLGLTSIASQQFFNIDHPVVGVLYKDMFKMDGATISLSTANSLLIELDLLVRVRTDNIMQATTLQEVANDISEIIPFIELPDVKFDSKADNRVLLLQAGNVGTRWGVLGKPFVVKNHENLLSQLENMQAFLKDNNGQLISQGKGKDILGHPLNAVLFLLEQLRHRNASLSASDVISLGAIGRFSPAKANTTYQAEYHGFQEQSLAVSVIVVD